MHLVPVARWHRPHRALRAAATLALVVATSCLATSCSASQRSTAAPPPAPGTSVAAAASTEITSPGAGTTTPPPATTTTSAAPASTATSLPPVTAPQLPAITEPFTLLPCPASPGSTLATVGCLEHQVVGIDQRITAVMGQLLGAARTPEATQAIVAQAAGFVAARQASCGPAGGAGGSIAALDVAQCELEFSSSELSRLQAATADGQVPRGDAPCRTTDLSAVARPGGSSAGHPTLLLVITNRSPGPCTLFGYVGMRMLDTTGRPMVTDAVRNGGQLATQPGPRTVIVGPGQQASALVQWSDVGDGALPCPVSARLEVTPPGQTRPLVVVAVIGACKGGELDVTALRQGAQGP